MPGSRVLAGLATILVLASGAFLAWASQPAITPVERPPPTGFSAALVANGARLAAVGDCSGCHTRPDGGPFAGGVALSTPFGTIFGSNITPDPDTGIGRWSEAAFLRAMRAGVRRDGQHLYPAFPYDHFTGLTEADIQALYAFLMTRDAVSTPTPPNQLAFPFSLRLTIAVWKLLFFHPSRPTPGPAEEQGRDRGAYLTDSLGHCGACHTPRNFLMAEESSRYLAGGRQEGWDAPALDRHSPAPVRWTAASLFAYLRRGSDPLHGVAAGPMSLVVHNLRSATDEDLRAISGYVVSVMGEPGSERRGQEEALAAARVAGEASSDPAVTTQGPEARNTQAAGSAPAGPEIFRGACAGCHGSGTRPFGGRPLEVQTAVALPDARNLIQIILAGVEPAEGEAGPTMPSFAATLSDQQIAAVVGYVRRRFSGQPAWGGLEDEVRKIRSGG